MPSEAQVTKSAIDRLKSAIQAKRKADKALVSALLDAALSRVERKVGWALTTLSSVDANRAFDSSL